MKCKGLFNIDTAVNSNLLSVFRRKKIIDWIEYSDLATIGFLWIASSAIFSTWTNFSFLQAFDDPLLHTFVRFFGAAIFSLFALTATGQLHSLVEVFEICKFVITAFLVFLLFSFLVLDT